MMPGVSAGNVPFIAERSLWQIPDARTLIRTSCGPGSTVVTSSRISSLSSPMA
jgi:hypothetical protein